MIFTRVSLQAGFSGEAEDAAQQASIIKSPCGFSKKGDAYKAAVRSIASIPGFVQALLSLKDLDTKALLLSQPLIRDAIADTASVRCLE